MPHTQTDFYNFAAAYEGSLSAGLFALASSAQDVASPLSKALTLLEQARARHAAVWLIGNGGAAALASHMATDLQLAGLSAQALTDVAAITTYANDDDFNHIFTDQLERLTHVGDVLIAVSTSGRSPNILQALWRARQMGLVTIGLLGTQPGSNNMDTACDVGVWLPAADAAHPGEQLAPTVRWRTGVQQDYAQVVLHLLAYWLISVPPAEQDGGWEDLVIGGA